MQVTDHVKLTGTAVLATSDVFCWSCALLGDFVQSPGTVRLTDRSELAGVNVPLLCIVVFTLTLNGVFVLIDGGAVTVTPVTLRSAWAVTAVVSGPPFALLLAPFGSLTCIWSMATAAEPLKSWFDWPEQVTDQVLLTWTTVLTGSELFCATWLPAGLFVQSAGVLRSIVVSVFTGVMAPLLWSDAVTVTLNAVLAFPPAGAETVTPVTLTSASPVTAVVPVAEPVSLPGVGSEMWSWSTATRAFPEN